MISHEQANPRFGKFFLWPILGINSTLMAEACAVIPGLACSARAVYTRQPRDFSAKDRELLAQHYAAWAEPVDLLEQRLHAVRELVHTPSPSGKPRVVFGHCECGCDRTGEFFGTVLTGPVILSFLLHSLCQLLLNFFVLG